MKVPSAFEVCNASGLLCRFWWVFQKSIEERCPAPILRQHPHYRYQWHDWATHVLLGELFRAVVVKDIFYIPCQVFPQGVLRDDQSCWLSTYKSKPLSGHHCSGNILKSNVSSELGLLFDEFVFCWSVSAQNYGKHRCCGAIFSLWVHTIVCKFKR